ncbi:MAG: hypothetical protein GF398_18930 [Chitinivibrionales bacterium]|nr:hypothetical protein [Chitinivibrionales bacterium]
MDPKKKIKRDVPQREQTGPSPESQKRKEKRYIPEIDKTVTSTRRPARKRKENNYVSRSFVAVWNEVTNGGRESSLRYDNPQINADYEVITADQTHWIDETGKEGLLHDNVAEEVIQRMGGGD